MAIARAAPHSISQTQQETWWHTIRCGAGEVDLHPDLKASRKERHWVWLDLRKCKNPPPVTVFREDTHTQDTLRSFCSIALMHLERKIISFWGRRPRTQETQSVNRPQEGLETYFTLTGCSLSAQMRLDPRKCKNPPPVTVFPTRPQVVQGHTS